MLSTQLKSLTDLRSNPLLIAQLARDEGPVYILNRNKLVSVMLDVTQYEELVDKLQDAIDVLEIREMKKNAKPEDFIPWEKVKKNSACKTCTKLPSNLRLKIFSSKS
ncbi:hypothetical protein A2634_02925 [Candidatus Amesbacteria bacterium RIFCSPHIGHO2_01_FULL_48_32]|uniref:Antitoxin n=1 Tax=Candidatus Amesbacteria bacterium RIFCSPLOWO2_01_FULL_48_25 TaxID=1797259 RepID=A0A1F4ZA90_9BACT|nr:MAG: hypothetical protein A2634_02925 [Candidatus Amesbacteria bacterium RIFCSPHIGHO2_01_FULL_48_32]OGD03095.1 MAG: hypothetical protein A2989_02145 [Candidatus Amesbacteria bacterium RIFCSPLOWO2_01_FULL_48_25]